MAPTDSIRSQPVKFRTRAAWLVALAAAAYPYLIAGFYQDDSLNSTLAGHLARTGTGVLAYSWEMALHWMESASRFYPLSFLLGYPIHVLFQSAWVYHAFQLALVAVDFALTSLVLAHFGASRAQVALTGALLLICFQIRPYYDPIASFGGLLQINLLFGLACVLFTQRAVASDARRPIADSASALLFYALAVCHYELGLCFLPIALYVCGKPSRPPAQVLVAGLISITLAYLATVAALKLVYGGSYPGTAAALTTRSLTSYLFQISAAFPLTHVVFGRSGYFAGDVETFEYFFFHPLLWICFGAAFTGVRSLLDDRAGQAPAAKCLVYERGEHDASPPLRFLGWALLLLPPVFVAISQRYQNEVARPGVGYLPVYFSCFGLAILAADRWATRLRPPGPTRRPWTAALYALVFALTVVSNARVSHGLNRFWKDPRDLLETAVRSGHLMEEAPDGALLLHNTGYYWMTDDLLEQWAPGRGLRVAHRSATTETSRYVLDWNASGPRCGWAQLSLADGWTRRFENKEGCSN